MSSPSPSTLGYRWPAEWEPHVATWLTWPHNPDTWPGLLEEVQATFGILAAALSRREEVRILAGTESIERSARETLRKAGATLDRIRFFRVPTNDSWIRDSGPIFVTRPGETAITAWGYNAWGGKYPPWDDDDRIPDRLAEALGLASFDPGMILEGGSIDGNGEGLVLTTEQCLLHPNRNPGLDRSAIEEALRRFLGTRAVVWLGDGIEGDDTDGHVDDLARFVGPRTVVTVVCDDPTDPNAEPLRENRRRLEAARTPEGEKLEVVPLPSPVAIRNDQGRLPASYANFYLANGAVLVPVFGDPADGPACEILGRLLPGREVVPVQAESLIAGFGAIHCLTQQQPAPDRGSP